MTTTIQRTAETCPGRPCGDGCDHVEFLPDPTIDTEVWEPDADRPGFLRRVRTKTIAEVFDELRAALPLDEYGCMDGCNEYLSVPLTTASTQPWPEGRIAVFPVTGGNEGHYTHVEVIHHTHGSTLVILGKTFDGWDNAWDFAKRVARVLGV